MIVVIAEVVVHANRDVVVRREEERNADGVAKERVSGGRNNLPTTGATRNDGKKSGQREGEDPLRETIVDRCHRMPSTTTTTVAVVVAGVVVVENVHLIVRRGVDVVATRIAATVLAVDHHCRDNDGSVTMNH